MSGGAAYSVVPFINKKELGRRGGNRRCRRKRESRGRDVLVQGPESLFGEPLSWPTAFLIVGVIANSVSFLSCASLQQGPTNPSPLACNCRMIT